MTGRPAPPPRSDGILQQRRQPLAWAPGRPFRILSLDGGGIKGIFPAAALAELERIYLGGAPIGDYFELITGVSTGGILALGMGLGIPASELLELYLRRGGEIFPPGARWRRAVRRALRPAYRRGPLDAALQEVLGGRKLRDSRARLCIPALDGRYGEAYIFKTPHHPDFRQDGDVPMRQAAAATSAAPTYFPLVQRGGYIFADGGVWANNPVMLGLVEALSSFAVRRRDIVILSLGCGDAPFTIGRLKLRFGGLAAWHNIIDAAMRLQSLNALGQAGLLLGRDKITRIVPPERRPPLALDDWPGAARELPGAARQRIAAQGEQIAAVFLTHPAERYEPQA